MKNCEYQLLPIKAVIAITSLSRATLYRKVSDGSFPAPIKIGDRRVAWHSGHVDAWVRGCADGKAFDHVLCAVGVRK